MFTYLKEVLKSTVFMFYSPGKTLLMLIVFVFVLFSAKAQVAGTKVDRQSYFKLLDKLKSDRDSMKVLYESSTPREKQDQRLRAEEYLLTVYYKKLIPYWLGTKWEFYGETQIPGDSSIACGHFVVTTLKHLGVNPERAHQMATDFSAYMVNSLCDSSYKVYKPEELLRIVAQRPDDVWVVGLHNHSGLLIKYKGQIRFVHSSYSYPTAVADEPADESHTFQHSTIYVAGNLFKNNSLTEKWIRSEEVKYIKKY